MVRETSREAYKQIKAQGLLGEKQLEVYECLFDYGPLTTNEIFSIVKGTSYISQSNISARVKELKDYGTVQEVGTKVCNITGRRVLLLDVTRNLPVKKKPISDKQKVKVLKKIINHIWPDVSKEKKQEAREMAKQIGL